MRNVCGLDVHKNNVFVCIFKENQTQFLLLPLMNRCKAMCGSILTVETDNRIVCVI